MNKGRIIIVSGPSGVGKGTVLRQVMEKNPKLKFSVSATTRTMRPGEVDGVHYYFMEKAQFEALMAEGGLLEHAFYAGNYYGTPAVPVEAALEQGISVILEIELQGARQVMERRPDAISIFIAPPSFAELRRRLDGRGDTTGAVAQRRLEIAREECAAAGEYQYIVVNNSVDQAAQELEAILTAEACRSKYRTFVCKEEE